MARAKASEPRKAKPSAAEELTHGITKLRELSTQIDDLSRDGFPYREAGRARTELSLRETIRRLFGEKSPEYQSHKNHKLRVGSRAESAQSTALIKQLVTALENQKADLSGLKLPAPATPPVAATTRPALTSVPVDTPADCPAALSAPSAPFPPTVTMAAPASVKPLPILLPAASLEPVRETSRPRQPDPSSSLPVGATENVPSSVPADGASPLEPRSSKAAMIPTSASTPTTISQGTIPPVSETSRLAIRTPASQSDTPPVRNVSGPVDNLKPPPSSPPSSTLRPVGTPGGATVEAPPNAQRHGAPNVVSEVVPSPLVPNPTQAMAFSEAPPALASAKKESAQSGQTESGTLDILRRVCARFHLVARQLRLRKEYRPTLEITDEYDLQDLFYALLRLQFDEVGTEEWTPDYANGARRTSYLLDWDRTVVVVKQTRSGLTTKDLAEQVKSDAAYYAARPNGHTLLCFIYDPDGRVGNPRGLEADLTTVSDRYMVEVIIAPK